MLQKERKNGKREKGREGERERERGRDQRVHPNLLFILMRTSKQRDSF